MRMTAMDIRQQQFAVRMFRGFDPQEVDAFLEEMADEVDELSRENAHLKEQLNAFEEKSRGVEGREKTLQDALVTTQRIAEDFKENARREAELVLRDAQLRSQKLLQDAREELAKLTAEVGGLRRLRRQFGEEIMNALAMHKRLAEQALAEGDAPAP